MEIKTCEHYVISKVMELENELDVAKTIIQEQEDEINCLEAQINFLARFFEIEYYGDVRCIEFKNVYDTSKPREFAEICRILDLELPNKENK